MSSDAPGQLINEVGLSGVVQRGVIGFPTMR